MNVAMTILDSIIIGHDLGHFGSLVLYCMYLNSKLGLLRRDLQWNG